MQKLQNFAVFCHFGNSKILGGRRFNRREYKTWKATFCVENRNKEANYVAQIYSRDAVEKLGLLEASAGFYFRLKLDKTSYKSPTICNFHFSEKKTKSRTENKEENFPRCAKKENILDFSATQLLQATISSEASILGTMKILSLMLHLLPPAISASNSHNNNHNNNQQSCEGRNAQFFNHDDPSKPNTVVLEKNCGHCCCNNELNHVSNKR